MGNSDFISASQEILERLKAIENSEPSATALYFDDFGGLSELRLEFSMLLYRFDPELPLYEEWKKFTGKPLPHRYSGREADYFARFAYYVQLFLRYLKEKD